MTPPERTGSWLVAGGVLLASLGLAVLLSWPLATSLPSALPLGTEPAASVPLLNLWTLWWNADRLTHGYQGYWRAPIFHPLEWTFALSEPQPLAGLASAPFFWLGAPPALAYNLLLLAALALNSTLAWLLLRRLSLGRVASLGGGGFVLALPFVWQELGVLQLVPLGGVLATLLALLAYRSEPSPRRALLLGLAFGSTYLLCGYYGLFLGLLLVAAAPGLFGSRLLRGETWKPLPLAALAALALIAPIALAQTRAGREHGLDRPRSTVERHAARPSHYLLAPWPERIPLVARADEPGARAFFPGTLKVALALAGLAWGLALRAYRRWAAFLVVLGGVAVLLSLGPRLDLWGWLPYELLARWVPGYGQVRSLFRFALFAQLAVALLAALGLEAVAAAGRAGSRGRAVAVVLAAGLALAGLEEMRPSSQRLQTLPGLEAPMPWLEWIERETGEGAVLAFLPMPTAGSSTAYEPTAQWMFWQMRHARRMVGGYSGYFPAPFGELKDRAASFPARRALRAFGERGVDYLVVLREYMEERPPAPEGALRLVFQDEANGVWIYAPGPAWEKPQKPGAGL